jgi:hypothetical protein
VDATRPVGVSLNGRPTNTTVEPGPAPLPRSGRISTTSLQLHGLEDDPELYERVIQRVRTSGETIRVEEVLGQLDDCAAGQPSPD